MTILQADGSSVSRQGDGDGGSVSHSGSESLVHTEHNIVSARPAIQLKVYYILECLLVDIE